MPTWIDNPSKVALVIALIGLVGGFLVILGQLAATAIPIWLGPDLSDYNIICDPAYHDIGLNSSLKLWENPTKSQMVYIGGNIYSSKQISGKPFINSSDRYNRYNMSFISYRSTKNKDYLMTLVAQNFNGTSLRNYEMEYGIFFSNISIASLHPLQKYTKDVTLIIACPVGFSSHLSNPIINLDRSAKLAKLVIIANITYLKNIMLREPNVFYQSDKELILSIKTDKTVFPITIQGIGTDGKKRNSTMLIEMKSQNEEDFLTFLTKFNNTNSSMEYVYEPGKAELKQASSIIKNWLYTTNNQFSLITLLPLYIIYHSIFISISN